MISIHPDCHILIQHNTGQDKEVNLRLGDREVRLEPVFFHSSNRLLEFKGLKFAKFVSSVRNFLPGFLRKKLFAAIPLLAALERADVVLDISGGDSFTSIYGDSVFKAITDVKEVVIRMNKPLILLPQSYGPFSSKEQIAVVRRILKGSKTIACRDENGPGEMVKLLENSDQGRLVSCPDLAFSLPADSSQNYLIKKFFESASVKEIKTVGFNISGLLYFGKKGFEFQSNYQELVEAILDWIVKELGAKVILVPHVVNAKVKKENSLVKETTDGEAINIVMHNLEDSLRKEIYVMPDTQDPRVIKGMISLCDYFLGSRMHACIAAISQAVPTICLAYSDKFSGVMRLIGQERAVVDLRGKNVVDVLQMMQDLNLNLEQERQRLVELNLENRKQIEIFFRENLENY